MKIYVKISDGAVIAREVDHWNPWGEGIRAYDGEGNCIVIVPGDHMVSFEVYEDDFDVEE